MCCPAARFLQVDIVGVDGELKDLAKNALTIKPNYTYYSSEVAVALASLSLTVNIHQTYSEHTVAVGNQCTG